MEENSKIKNIKFYRQPWTKEKVEYLIQWWPHWGSKIIAEQLLLTTQQVKSKIEKLKIKLLPKNLRICIQCKNIGQYKRFIKCHKCYLVNREKTRRENGIMKKNKIKEKELQWISRLTGGRKTRKKELCENKQNLIDTEFMYHLWKSQNGLCYYSGIKMNFPEKGKQRTPYTASIDRLDSSKGYIKDNVVWCCWFYNHAKNNLKLEDFKKLCSSIKSS